MNTKSRLISFILILCLTSAVCLVACDDTEKDPPETDYDFSVFFGSLDDAIEIDAILTEYEKSTGVKINPVIISNGKDNKGTLESLLNDEDPPAAYAVAEDIDVQWLSQGGMIADFGTIDENMEGNNFPYILDGYGLAFDGTMFEEMFGKEKAENLINNLRKATYEEWTVFVNGLNDYINDRNPGSFTIGGNSYKFPAEKGELTENLNGVFAIPGADSGVYGDSLLNMVMQTADLSEWEAAKDDLSGSAVQTLNPTLTTYVNGLDMMTSYLSGEYSPGIRGTDFINEEYYSSQKTDAMFMEGKAMFSVIDSRKYNEIETLNAKKALNLKYLPIKMPYDSSLGGKTSDGAILNSSIPAGVSYSFYINNKCSGDIQKKALEFLIWFMEQEEKWSNPLSSSVKTYVEEGNIFESPYEPEELSSWKEEVFGDGNFGRYLRREPWSDDFKNEIKAYLTEMWCEN